MKFSAIEIYNEAIRDLLSTENIPLRVLDDPEVTSCLIVYGLIIVCNVSMHTPYLLFLLINLRKGQL